MCCSSNFLMDELSQIKLRSIKVTFSHGPYRHVWCRWRRQWWRLHIRVADGLVVELQCLSATTVSALLRSTRHDTLRI
jgi:hypothetical protein